jgi:hypothetical protein
MIIQHGREALAVAMLRWLRWEAARQLDTAETWRRIAAAIKTLERMQ